MYVVPVWFSACPLIHVYKAWPHRTVPSDCVCYVARPYINTYLNTVSKSKRNFEISLWLWLLIMICILYISILTLWPSGTTWRHIFMSKLAQVMACCPTTSSHYLNQLRLISSKVQWYPDSNIERDTWAIDHQIQLENYLSKISSTFLMDQCITALSQTSRVSCQKGLRMADRALLAGYPQLVLCVLPQYGAVTNWGSLITTRLSQFNKMGERSWPQKSWKSAIT